MTLLPFFNQENGLGTKPPDKGRSSNVSSSAIAMGRTMGRHRLSKLSTLLILSMSASAASQDVLHQKHPKQPDLLEAKLFDTNPGRQGRNFDSDGGNIMMVSIH